ncbi:MAG: hypothetical protein WCI51_11865 [Lentisphaerota bacterium]
MNHTTSKKIIAAILASTALGILSAETVAASKEAPMREYANANYKVQISDYSLFDSAQKNSGMILLEINGKKFLYGDRCFSKIFDDKKAAIQLTTLPAENYTVERTGQDIVVTTVKKLVPPKNANEVMGEITKVITFKDSEIQIQMTLEAKKDLSYDLNKELISDFLDLSIENTIGFNVEGHANNTVDMSLIEKEYNKERWGTNAFYDNVKIAGEKEAFTFTAEKNCKIRINHYGGRMIEAQVYAYRENPNNQPYILKAGNKVEWSYTIKIEKF